MIGVTDALGNKTTYTYDNAGNMLSMTDGNGNTTTYEYNVANLLIAKIDPTSEETTSKSERYTYYANGLMATKTDRNGIAITFSYDIFGRKINEDASGEVQTYTYDNNGNLLTMTDKTGTTFRTYDGLNRTISKTVPEIGESLYQYDIVAEHAGEHSETNKDTNGNVTIKTFDKVGRLSVVTVGNKSTTYEYLPNGVSSKVTNTMQNNGVGALPCPAPINPNSKPANEVDNKTNTSINPASVNPPENISSTTGTASAGGNNKNNNKKNEKKDDKKDGGKKGDTDYNLSKKAQEHIYENHGTDSTIPNKSKFNENFNIEEGINEALTNPNSVIKPNTNGRPGNIYEYTFEDPIGISSNNKLINTIKVVVDAFRNVITAYPIK